jgi:hypothetical protein
VENDVVPAGWKYHNQKFSIYSKTKFQSVKRHGLHNFNNELKTANNGTLRHVQRLWRRNRSETIEAI